MSIRRFMPSDQRPTKLTVSGGELDRMPAVQCFIHHTELPNTPVGAMIVPDKLAASQRNRALRLTHAWRIIQKIGISAWTDAVDNRLHAAREGSAVGRHLVHLIHAEFPIQADDRP